LFVHVFLFFSVKRFTRSGETSYQKKKTGRGFGQEIEEISTLMSICTSRRGEKKKKKKKRKEGRIRARAYASELLTGYLTNLTHSPHPPHTPASPSQNRSRRIDRYLVAPKKYISKTD
jgi:hypothetical protein